MSKTKLQLEINPEIDNCCYCGRSLKDINNEYIFLNRDHLIPLSRGGSNDLSNLKICCSECNNEKANRTIKQYIIYLEKKLIMMSKSRFAPYLKFKFELTKKKIKNCKELDKYIETVGNSVYKKRFAK